MHNVNFYLVSLPIYAISIFYFFCIISAYFYPGSEKEIINYKSENYSFTHNFFSELFKNSQNQEYLKITPFQ